MTNPTTIIFLFIHLTTFMPKHSKIIIATIMSVASIVIIIACKLTSKNVYFSPAKVRKGQGLFGIYMTICNMISHCAKLVQKEEER